MSIKNAISASDTLQERLEQINFQAFFSNAEAIDAAALRESTISKLKYVKERVKNLEGRIQKSSHLSNGFLKNHVIKTIRRIPKEIPAEVLEYDDDDAQLFREIFTEVRESLKSIRDALDEQFQKELVQEGSLLTEQESLHEDEAFIERLRTFPQILNNTPPKVYMAYASPLDKAKIIRREKKVQLFLQKLETHLMHLGVITKLDTKDCPKESSTYEYMKKEIDKSDVFLLFGTESLLRKMKAHGGVPLYDHHAGGYPLICYELGQANKKATKAKTRKEKLDRPAILPVLLTGNMDKSFPEYFQGNKNVVLFPEVGYLEGLKRIVYVLYAFQKLGTRKPIFDQGWKNWFEWKKPVQLEDGQILQGTASNFSAPLDSDLNLAEEENKKICQLNTRINSLVNDLKRQEKATEEAQMKQQTLQEKVNLLDEELALERTKEIEILQAGSKKILPGIAFGKADWERYFGEVGEEPPLPGNIEEILKKPCPFWPDKRVEETHLLVLIPQTVNGAPLTLSSLSELIKFPKQGFKTRFRLYDSNVKEECGESTALNSYWVLMTGDILGGTFEKTLQECCAIVSGYKGYEIPDILDVATTILMQYVKTGVNTIRNLTDVYCRQSVTNEMQVAFNIGSEGVSIYPQKTSASRSGVNAIRKFFNIRNEENKKKFQERVILNDRIDVLAQALRDANEKLLLFQETVLTQAKKIEELQTKPAKNLPDIAFGKADWEAYFGEVGEEPPLPANIEEILKSACPFWPNKRVEETHILTLIPQMVNGAPLTLDSLSELIKTLKRGPATRYKYFDEDIQKEYGKQTASSSHWFLLTKDNIPNSVDKSFSNQCALLANAKNYEVPQLLDAAASILMHYVKKGERRYSEEPCSFTRCQEKVNGWSAVVGGFSPGGLGIHNYYYDGLYVGVGGSRKF